MLMLLAILPGLTGNFLPQTQATPTGNSFLTEIGTFKHLWGVDVDSSGRVFIKVNNTIWRSTDGQTFSKVLDTGETGGGGASLMRTDSGDRIFSSIFDGTNYDLYRSKNHGDTWQIVLGNIPNIWRLTAMSNGTLLINTYHTGKDALIYHSDDNGTTWSMWQNLTAIATDHIHFVRVNPYNDDIWVGCGDQDNAPLGYHNGTAWTWIFSSTNNW